MIDHLKILLIVYIFLQNILAMTMDFQPQIEIDRITSLKTKAEIHKNLLALKKNNLLFLQFLKAEKSYRSDEFNYSNILELLLEKIPEDLSQMASCPNLIESLQSDYKTSWEYLEPPTHEIWPAFKKLCEK